MTTLSGRILTPDGGLLRGRLVVEDGRVAALREGQAPDRLLVPGYVDLHVHGGGGADVMDGPEGMSAVAAFHLRHGTTSLCPTTVTRPLDELRAVVAAAAALDEAPERARVLGVHLEGPFIAEAKRGAQPPHVLAPDPQALTALLDAGPVDVVTLAPELPGSLELVRLLAARGVRASLGHSACDAAAAAAAFTEGAGGVTHLFNAMSGMHHRRPGLALAALEAEGVIHELILDGHHVDAAMFRFAHRVARGRLALVTDAIRAAGLGEGTSELGGQTLTVKNGRATLPDGTLAGSLATLDASLRRAVKAGLALEDGLLLLTKNPADALGREDLGRLAPGAHADVLELDEGLDVVRVFRGGVEVDLGVRATLLVACLALTACAPFDPADLPESEAWILAIKSCKLPPDVATPVSLAHHSWFDFKQGSEDDWGRLEVITTEAFTDEDVLDDVPISRVEGRRLERWGRDVHLHTVVTGEDARRMIADLRRQGQAYEDRANYRGWAGPNSNTFVDRLVRDTPGLRVELHHNAVGKDYTPLIRIGPTTTGLGLELDTYLFGIQLGIEEGIEVHFLNLTFGVDFFPPAIKLPFAPRLGFPDANLFD